VPAASFPDSKYKKEIVSVQTVEKVVAVHNILYAPDFKPTRSWQYLRW